MTKQVASRRVKESRKKLVKKCRSTKRSILDTEPRWRQEQRRNTLLLLFGIVLRFIGRIIKTYLHIHHPHTVSGAENKHEKTFAGALQM